MTSKRTPYMEAAESLIDRLQLENERLQRNVESLGREVERLRAGFQRIKSESGRVCSEYEVCTHVACASSHHAWELADAVLTRQEALFQ